MRLWTNRVGMLVGSALVAGALVACGGGAEEGGAAAPSGGSTASGPITVTLSEWSVKPSAAKAKAGSVTFKTSNKGAVAHELAVFKTDSEATKIPVAGAAADETKVTVVGRTASIDAGKSEDKTFELAAGKYVLVCNLPAHYQQGMTTAFTVE